MYVAINKLGVFILYEFNMKINLDLYIKRIKNKLLNYLATYFIFHIVL